MVPECRLPQLAMSDDFLSQLKAQLNAAAPDKTAERRSRVADMLERLLHMPEDDGPDAAGEPDDGKKDGG